MNLEINSYSSKRRFLPNGVNYDIFNKIKLSKKYKKESLKIVYLESWEIIDDKLILKISKNFLMIKFIS